MWYTVWLVLGLKAFVVNWLIRHQPIRIAWVPVTGPAETLYLLIELAVVGWIVWQAWRFERADPSTRPSTGSGLARDSAYPGETAWLHWRAAFLYEWYSLAEIGLSLANPHLWTYAMHQMWGVSALRHPTGQTLTVHVGFVAFYAFMHHGLPLLVLGKLSRQAQPLPLPPSRCALRSGSASRVCP